MRVPQILGPSTGGIRVHVATLAAGLEDLGVDAPVLGPPGVLDGLGPQAGIIDVPAGLSPVGLLGARRALRPWRGPADVLHAHGLKAAWCCVHGRPERPVVVTVHNVVLDEDGARSVQFRRRLERAVLGRADRVIAPTAAIAHGLAGVVAPERVRVIVPASPSPVIERARSDIRARIGISDDTPLVVCVGRLHPQKDLPTLLHAWTRVRDVVADGHLAIVGEGPSRPAVESLIGALGVDGSVHLVGFDRHAVDWLGAADVVAVTSVWEAIPLVLAEALQLGVPVVSTEVGLARDLLGDAAAGAVVPVGDAAAVAEALVDLMVDVDRRRGAGAVASERSAERFDPSMLVESVRDVYAELAGSGSDRIR